MVKKVAGYHRVSVVILVLLHAAEHGVPEGVRAASTDLRLLDQRSGRGHSLYEWIGQRNFKAFGGALHLDEVGTGCGGVDGHVFVS
ncbi:Uncharacterised protein [Mycobacteroides abscessus subsp. abscessus]|nr:Uncharacterised protein [Mycobacteroides abscessus subsp. abscessus]